MPATAIPTDTPRYAKTIEVSRRIRWDIDHDVIRGRTFSLADTFLPDGLSLANELPFLSPDEQRFLSQVQGRTYANMFGLVERYITAKIMEVSRSHVFGDQTAFEALVRFTDEELKHQELFRRMERMIAEGMPAGYAFLPQPNDVASLVLGKSTWAVLALICCIELFVLAHYHQSIGPDSESSELWKDVFLYHAREESQHAILDELEWVRENAKITPAERDRGVDDLIQLVAAVDGMLRLQAKADADYFVNQCRRPLTVAESDRIRGVLLDAYRWQYIISGVQDPRFTEVLGGMIDGAQAKRLADALDPIVHSTTH